LKLRTPAAQFESRHCRVPARFKLFDEFSND